MSASQLSRVKPSHSILGLALDLRIGGHGPPPGLRPRNTERRSKTDQAGQGAILYVTAATMAALDAIRQGAPNAAPVFGLEAREATAIEVGQRRKDRRNSQ